MHPMRAPDEHRTYYDAFYAQGDFRHHPPDIDQTLLERVFRRTRTAAGSRVLDLGCGTGVQMMQMRALGMQTTGVDISAVALRRAAERVPSADFAQGDGLRLPFRAGCFDAVLLFGCSLLNTDAPEDIAATFAESMRVTRPGGWVVACTSSDFSGTSKGGWVQHTRAFLADSLARIVGAERFLRCTLPRLGRVHAALVLHRVVDTLLRLPFPGLTRTIVFGVRVDARDQNAIPNSIS